MIYFRIIIDFSYKILVTGFYSDATLLVTWITCHAYQNCWGKCNGCNFYPFQDIITQHRTCETKGFQLAIS